MFLPDPSLKALVRPPGGDRDPFARPIVNAGWLYGALFIEAKL